MSEGAWPLTVMARETGYMVSTADASVQRMHSSGTSSSRTWTQRVTAWGTRAHGAEGTEGTVGTGQRAQRAQGRGQRAKGRARAQRAEGTEGRGQRAQWAEGREPRSHVLKLLLEDDTLAQSIGLSTVCCTHRSATLTRTAASLLRDRCSPCRTRRPTR